MQNKFSFVLHNTYSTINPYNESDVKDFATQWLDIPESVYNNLSEADKIKLTQSGPYARYRLSKATDEFGRELKRLLLPLFNPIMKVVDRFVR